MSKKQGCTNCGETAYRICKVCCLVDGNCGNQKLCTYCGTCNAWLCADDKQYTPTALMRRAEAMIKNKLRRNPYPIDL